VRCLVNGVSGRNAAFLFELIGAKGRITVSEERPPQFRLVVADDGRMREEPFPAVPEEEQINTFGVGRCVLPASVENIVESLDRRADSLSPGHDGRAALEMVLSFHESERLRNARVDFPLANRDLRVLVRPESFISSARPEA
jgi:hypothetical protein